MGDASAGDSTVCRQPPAMDRTDINKKAKTWRTAPQATPVRSTFASRSPGPSFGFPYPSRTLDRNLALLAPPSGTKPSPFWLPSAILCYPQPICGRLLRAPQAIPAPVVTRLASQVPRWLPTLLATCRGWWDPSRP